MNIAEYIDNIREEQGRTKIWLAEFLGITKQNLNYKFKNSSFLAEELIRISRVLNIDLEKMKKEVE